MPTTRVPAATVTSAAVVVVSAIVAVSAMPVRRQQPAAEALGPLRAPCMDLDTPLPRLAALLEGTGPGVRGVLQQMASGPDDGARWCGIRGLAALRDPAVVAAVRAAWRDRRAEAWRVARWAAYAAGGPDRATTDAFAPLVDDLAMPALAAAAGDDGVRLLGELESAAAREALLALLARDDVPATVDAAIHALARQGEPRARERVTALGQIVVNGLGGNAMFEEARRIHAAAFYLLALGSDSRDAGLAMLTRLAPGDQVDAAAWAVQTLCERAIRRPAERAPLEATRAALVAALRGPGIQWDSVTRGTFPCPAR